MSHVLAHVPVCSASHLIKCYRVNLYFHMLSHVKTCGLWSRVLLLSLNMFLHMCHVITCENLSHVITRSFHVWPQLQFVSLPRLSALSWTAADCSSEITNCSFWYFTTWNVRTIPEFVCINGRMALRHNCRLLSDDVARTLACSIATTRLDCCNSLIMYNKPTET